DSLSDSELEGDLAAEEQEETREQGRLLRAIVTRYEWLLGKALDHRPAVVIVCIAVVVLSFVVYQKLGSEFLPEFDEGAFVLDYFTPPGTSLAETDRILKQIEEMLQDPKREVESYSRRTGLQLGLFITEPNTGDFLVKLKPDRKQSTEDIKDDLRKEIASTEPALNRVELPGILGDLIGDLTSEPQPVEIKLFSEDANALHQKAAEIEKAIKEIPGIVDTFDGLAVSGPAITFKVDPQRAAQLGVNATDIAGTVTTAMTGDSSTSIIRQDRKIDVRVVLPKESRESLDTLRALPIRSSAKSALFRLDQVVDIDYDKGQAEIARDGLRQTVAVTARLEGIDLGSAIDAIRKKLDAEVGLPRGMTLEYGGLSREQQSSFREMTMALGLAVALVFITLLIEFRSFSHPFAIVTGAVLALSGVLSALLITRTTLNVVSYMGMIMVVGIVAKNGILMLDAVEDHLESGDSLRDALIRSGRRRFRPVLMTSLAAMLGMLP